MLLIMGNLPQAQVSKTHCTVNKASLAAIVLRLPTPMKSHDKVPLDASTSIPNIVSASSVARIPAADGQLVQRFSVLRPHGSKARLWQCDWRERSETDFGR